MTLMPLLAAWVLWLAIPNPMTAGEFVVWVPQDGYENLALCRAAQAERQRSLGTAPSDAKTWVIVGCFPDTFDPRGKTK